MQTNLQDKQPKQIDKSFFGMYLNQARLNAHIVLCHISDLLGENVVSEDSLAEMPVLKYLEHDKDLLKSKRVMELLDKHFPMLKIIYDSQKPKDAESDFLERAKAYKEIMVCLLKPLNCKRNEYCHACATVRTDYDIRGLIYYLEYCFDAAVRKVKEDRSLSEDEVMHLRRKISEGRGKDKRIFDNPGFYYSFRDDRNHLNEKGLAFLASLFLEKRDIFLFLKKQEGFHRDDTPGYKATLECYCCYRIKLPKPVMTSDVDATGLALDMLNELKKCPRELFDLLSKDKQNEFRVTEKTEDDEDSAEILMRRYSDRFAYFALRYCDENKVFQKLRFHIDLGRYYFEFYEKHTLDGGIHQRSLDKQMKTFGRIQEIKESVRREWGNIRKSPAEHTEDPDTPYKTDTEPHYHLVGNQIGLVIEPVAGLPAFDKPLQKPDAWLSAYELPAVLFYGMQFGFNEVENKIIQYVKSQQKHCQKIRETGTIPSEADTFLPKAFTYNRIADGKYGECKLQRMIRETQKRLKAIESTEKRAGDTGNKPGKKGYIDIRCGKLADFLARDIVALQTFDESKNGSDKITSINFQVLQATLAYFGAKKDSLPDLLRAIDQPEGRPLHPFLKNLRASGYTSIAAFYKAYLRQRKSYLQQCLDNNEYDHQFLRPTRKRYDGELQAPKTIAEKLLNQPVNIPKGFFQNKIREFVCAELPDLQAREMNTAYMIQEWFEHKYGKQQPFYFYEKTCPVVAKAREYIKKRKNERIAKALSELSPTMNYNEMKSFVQKNIPKTGRYDPETLRDNLLKGCTDFKNNERTLRRLKVQDRVTFLMIERTLKEQLSFADHALKLETIGPKEASLFKKPITCTTHISIAFSTRASHEAGYVGFIQERYSDRRRTEGKRLLLDYRITSASAKLKDLGKYRRYFYDRRLPGLLIWKYAPNSDGSSEIHYQDIEKEIEAYEKQRAVIVRTLYELETQIIADCGLDGGSENTYIPFNRIIDTLKTRLPEYAAECDVLLNIRNAVFHNQFPAYAETIEHAEGCFVAEKMKTATETIVGQINEKGFADG